MNNRIFTEADYKSADGFNVNFWGKILWTFLHTISFNYPVNPTLEDKKNYHNFIMSLQFILPCKACRDHYVENLNAVNYNIHCLENRLSFSMFIYRLHNSVNKMLGKPCELTYDEVRDRYELCRARCLNDTPILPRNAATNCEPATKLKSVISIVPLSNKKKTFIIDPKCFPKK